MNFLKSTVMGLGSAFTSGGVGGLPFTLVDTPGEETAQVAEFQLLKAKSKQDGTRVSVFKSSAPACPLTQNALRRTKTLRHPNVLAYIDGTEVANGNVFIVTEEVVPLRQYLEDIRAKNGANSNEETLAVSWGLRAVLSALKFINMDCKMIHGRVNPESIFVTKGGDWKLAGFQLTGELSMDGPFLLHHRSSGAKAGIDQDPRYKCPELSRGDWAAISSGPVHAVDMYAFASTVVSIFNPSFSSSSDTRGVPSGLSTLLKRASDQTATRRLLPDQAVQASFFDSSFIRQMTFLEQLAIKSSEEKTEFYKELVANVDNLPRTIALYKVLPALKAVVDFGVATSAGGKSATYKLDPCESQMLPAMVKIGSHLEADDFKEQVLPTLVKLFGCNDRAVRVQLLQMMDTFAVHFDAKLVNSAVFFDNICTGFHDTMPLLRELTMKSMLHIADKLSDSNLNQKLMKHFAKLQVDPEPAIRTNTTICLGKVATYMNATTRAKVLLPAFCRALKDPFPHAKLAGLRTLVACDEYFTPADICATIIPSISPLMLDVSPSVRDEAISSMKEYMKKAEAESQRMKVQEAQQEAERATQAPDVPPPKQQAPIEAHVPAPAPLSSSSSNWSQGVAASTSTSNWSQAVTASSTSVDDDDFGDDNGWGDDDELDGLASPPTKAPVSLGGVSQAPAKPVVGLQSSFGSMSLSKPAAPAPAVKQPEKSFFDDWPSDPAPPRSNPTPAVSQATFASSDDSLKPRKTLQERKLEAKAKKDSLGAMKLQSKPKGGDNWDWDM